MSYASLEAPARNLCENLRGLEGVVVLSRKKRCGQITVGFANFRCGAVGTCLSNTPVYTQPQLLKEKFWLVMHSAVHRHRHIDYMGNSANPTISTPSSSVVVSERAHKPNRERGYRVLTAPLVLVSKKKNGTFMIAAVRTSSLLNATQRMALFIRDVCPSLRSSYRSCYSFCGRSMSDKNLKVTNSTYGHTNFSGVRYLRGKINAP